MKLKEKQDEEEQNEGNDGKRKEEAVYTHTPFIICTTQNVPKTAGFTLPQTVTYIIRLVMSRSYVLCLCGCLHVRVHV